MKKSLIAMAVAGAITAPAANAATTLYGALGQTLSQVDSVTSFDGTAAIPAYVAGTDTTVGGTEYDAARVHDNTTVFGVKGSEDLGNGLSAIYQVEYGVGLNGKSSKATDATTGKVTNADNQHNFVQRNTFVGVKGGFGTFLMGRHDVPGKIALGKVAYAFPGMSSGSGHTINSAVHIGFDHNLRANNVLAYISPNWGGFKFALATVAGEASNTATATDVASGIAEGMSLGLMYSNGPWYAGLGYTKLSGELLGNQTTDTMVFEERGIIGLALKYAPGPWEIGYLFETVDEGSVKEIDRHYLYGAYAFGNNKLYLQYGMADGDFGVLTANDATDDVNLERTVYGIGLKHSLSKRTAAFVAYTANENDVSRATANADETFDYNDGSIFSIGLRHKF